MRQCLEKDIESKERFWILFRFLTSKEACVQMGVL